MYVHWFVEWFLLSVMHFVILTEFLMKVISFVISLKSSLRMYQGVNFLNGSFMKFSEKKDNICLANVSNLYKVMKEYL